MSSQGHSSAPPHSPRARMASVASVKRPAYPPVSLNNAAAFVLAFTCSVCAGSISLFSIFAPSIQRDTGLRVMDLNYVAIAAELGQYIPVPLVGFMADRFGPKYAGMLATLLFCPGYYVSAMVVQASLDFSHGKELSALSSFLVENNITILVVAFFAIGTATSSLHFCGVVTSAKVLPQFPGFSISGPIAAYGLSSLWQSQLISDYFTIPGNDGGYIRIVPVFYFFTVLYFFTGFIAYFASYVGTFLVTDSDDAADDDADVQTLDNDSMLYDKITQPVPANGTTGKLLLQDTLSYDAIPNTETRSHSMAVSGGASHEATPLLQPAVVSVGPSCPPSVPTAASSRTITPADSPAIGEEDDAACFLRDPNTVTFSEFITDKTAWILFAGFVLATGPLEMAVNNMGMMLNTIPAAVRQAAPVATHVALFSAFSTLARLTMGLLSDLVEAHVSRVTIFCVVLFVASGVQFATAAGLFTTYQDGHYFSVFSSATGFFYGSCFTITPTIVAAIWGLRRFGTNYGTFILGPAIGATVCGYIFAAVYESTADKQQHFADINKLMSAAQYIGETLADATLRRRQTQDPVDPDMMKNLQCYGVSCYEATFILTGAFFIVAGLLIFGVYVFFWKPARRLGPR